MSAALASESMPPITAPRRRHDRRAADRVPGAAWPGCLVALLAAPFALAADGIGFASVADARAMLDARGDVVAAMLDGWTVLEEAAAPGRTQWAFVPPAHPAYPALVRRDVVMKAGVPTLVTRFLCEGRRAACERLYRRVRAHGASGATTPLPALVP